MKHSFWVSLIGVETKSEHNLHAELLRDVWNQVLTKPSPKSRNHCSELNNSWISMKQSVFASLRCGATKSQQILQTELRRDKRNEVLTKTLTKSRNHCSELNKCWIPMKQKSSSFLYVWWNKILTTFINRSVSSQMKSSISENTHQSPENTDWS